MNMLPWFVGMVLSSSTIRTSSASFSVRLGFIKLSKETELKGKESMFEHRVLGGGRITLDIATRGIVVYSYS